MITGTCHFYDKEGAYFYYATYGISKQEVDEKLKSGEIKTGRPLAKECERVFLNTKEMRYFIESTDGREGKGCFSLNFTN